MHIVVLGGAGFIGTNLCKSLLKKDHHVYCVDNLYTGSKKNIQTLLAYTNFNFIYANTIDWICYLPKVDYIYNLACPASPVHYQSNPIYTGQTNVAGTLTALRLADAFTCPILQASTSEVYGDPMEHPQKETYWGNVNPIGIRSCYDEGKRFAETLCMDSYRTMGVQIKIVRIFNTYGPYMQPNDGRVISNFIMQALQDECITIYGDGMQTRSFCYVTDLVEGLEKMMDTAADFTGPVNLGNPNEMPIILLAKTIKELTGSTVGFNFKPLPKDDPKRRRPDITQAKEYLAWKPKTKILDGLEKTIQYFKTIQGGL